MSSTQKGGGSEVCAFGWNEIATCKFDVLKYYCYAQKLHNTKPLKSHRETVGKLIALEGDMLAQQEGKSNNCICISNRYILQIIPCDAAPYSITYHQMRAAYQSIFIFFLGFTGYQAHWQQVDVIKGCIEPTWLTLPSNQSKG